MRRRQSTKSRSDLQRHKSTSSVHSVRLEHIDPNLAERDAQVAAREAFARAQTRLSADMSLFPPSRQTSPQRSPLRGDVQPRLSTSSGDRAGARANHRRQQSVRSIRISGDANSSTLRHGASTRSGSTENSGEATQFLSNMDLEREGSEFLRSTEKQIAVVQNEPLRKPPPIPTTALAGDYLNALVAQDEVYTPEDDIASAPSSYRRLRKSRSMFTSGDSRLRISQDETHITRPSMSRLPQSQTCRVLGSEADKQNANHTSEAPRLRAPKSMSFLKTRRMRAGSLSTRESDLVQDKPKPAGLPQLRSKHSLFFTPRSSRGRKHAFGSIGMRKSLRSGSSVYEQATGSTVQVVPTTKDDGLRDKARKVSHTLKTRLKNLFNISRSEADAGVMPEQHIEAQKSHVVFPFTSTTSLHENGYCQDGIEEGSLRRVPTNFPSLRSVASTHALRCSRGSLESIVGEHERRVSDDHSLTSWANSGPSTLTSQQQREWGEWERQRLSVIRENGAHAPSPSVRRPSALNKFPPLPEDVSNPSNTNSAPLDSQKVYTALMKRLGETRQLALEQQRRTSSEYQDRIPFEERLSRTAQASPLTIRAVRPEDDVCPDTTPTPKEKRGSKFDFSDEPSAGRLGADSAGSDCYKAYPKPTAGDGRGLSPSPMLKPLDDPSLAKKGPLLDRGSGFFGTPQFHLFRTVSPYRRALRKSIEKETGSNEPRDWTTNKRLEDNASPVHVPYADNNLRAENLDKGRHSVAKDDLAYTESVYSCQTEERAPRTIASPPSLSGASMSEDPPVTYRPTRGHRSVDSTISSIEWKEWLAANISRLEPSSSPSKLSEIEFVLPTMPRSFSGAQGPGHVRENAQTDRDDTDIEPMRTPPYQRSTYATTPLSTVEPNVVKVSPQQHTMKHAQPSQMLGRCLPENTSLKPGPPPPVPARSPMRTVPASMRSQRCDFARAGEGYSITSSPGLSAAVQRQFGAARRGAPVPMRSEQKENDYQDGERRAFAAMESSREAEIRGSRRIVDIFLSGRRHRMTPEEGRSRAFI